MRALGIILAGGNNNRMRELSNRRAIAAMPVAGSYRSIDFALSNMTNSHIAKVAVLTQYNARSLNEHLSYQGCSPCRSYHIDSCNLPVAGWKYNLLHQDNKKEQKRNL